MAIVTIKLFGNLRMDTHLAKEEIVADTLDEIFDLLNSRVQKTYTEQKEHHPMLQPPDPITFKDAIVYIDGKRTVKKHYRLKGGEEIWLMSPASGG